MLMAGVYFFMIQPECLECRLECMIQVKSQNDEQDDVENRINRAGKELPCSAYRNWFAVLQRRNRILQPIPV